MIYTHEFSMVLTGCAEDAQKKAGKKVTKLAVSIEWDPTDTSIMEKFVFGGQSARVSLQGQLRTWPGKELDDLGGIFKTTLQAIHDNEISRKTGRDNASASGYKKALAAMSRETAIERIMQDFGVTADVAAAFIANL